MGMPSKRKLRNSGDGGESPAPKWRRGYNLRPRRVSAGDVATATNGETRSEPNGRTRAAPDPDGDAHMGRAAGNAEAPVHAVRDAAPTSMEVDTVADRSVVAASGDRASRVGLPQVTAAVVAVAKKPRGAVAKDVSAAASTPQPMEDAPDDSTGVGDEKVPLVRPRRQVVQRVMGPKSGVEDGVEWHWVGNLKFKLSLPDGTEVEVPPHAIHDRNVGQAGGNLFLGSYSVVGKKGSTVLAPAEVEFNPTEEEHTEPQYLAWFKQQTEGLNSTSGVHAIVMEINQTNTPCSQASCRPALLQLASSSKDPIIIVRMSAYQRYETQPPKGALNFIDAKRIGAGDGMVTLHRGAAIHRIPANMR